MSNIKASDLRVQLENCTHDEFLNLKKLHEEDTRKNILALFDKTEKKFDKLDKIINEYNARKKFELELYKKGYKYIAGIDEVGRGPLAGPVYTCAVILDPTVDILGIKDSKKLSEGMRDALSAEIMSKCLAYSIGTASVEEIDEYNILNATKLAMKRAIESLSIKPDYILIDALELDGIEIPQKPIIKGDDLSISIGAASIVAKVERDNYMNMLAKEHPQYLLDKNKGYGTAEHIAAIKEHGIRNIHRKTFVKNFI